MTVTGPGAGTLTIDRNDGAGVAFPLAAGGALTLSGLTVTGGLRGVSLVASGSAALTASTFTGNGVGVYFAGGGTATLANSTLFGNGDGLSFAQGGAATVTNSTLGGNRWGIYFSAGGAATVTNATLGGNTAGLVFDRGGTATLANALLAGGGGANCTFTGGGTLTNTAHNLADDATCSADGANGSLVRTTAQLGLDPAGLADNGGPTQTIALLAGSAAIDAGDDPTCAQTGAGKVNQLDQRGAARPQGAHCDIGAFERGGVPPANPSSNPSPGKVVTLTLGTAGAGGGTATPLGTTSHALNALVTLTAFPQFGSSFVGWTVDGTLVSWATTATLTMGASHTVVATFQPVPRFIDVPQAQPFTDPVQQLAARGIINGCFTDPSSQAKDFCPTDNTLRHQMAALIARAMPGWVGETGLPTFSDNTDDTELMTRVATLQRHGVVRGYQDAVCAERHIAPPCYGPLDAVKYGQVLLFIARAMINHNYWALQDDDRTIFPDQNGAATADPDTDQQTLDHRAVVTYVHYAGAPPDVPDVHAPFLVADGAPAGWGDDSNRGWFSRAFWAALDQYFGGRTALP